MTPDDEMAVWRPADPPPRRRFWLELAGFGFLMAVILAGLVL